MCVCTSTYMYSLVWVGAGKDQPSASADNLVSTCQWDEPRRKTFWLDGRMDGVDGWILQMAAACC